MSGRGRGRGRGRGGVTSQARLLLQRSATEAGVDERSAIESSRPALYPDMYWHSSGRQIPSEEAEAIIASTDATALQFTKRTPSMTRHVLKQRQLLEAFQSSPQYIRHVPPHMDIARYNERVSSTSDRPDQAVLDALGRLASPAFLPSELLGSRDGTTNPTNRKRRRPDGTEIDLDELEAREKGGGDQADGDGDSEEDEDNADFLPTLEEDDEEEQDNMDYTTNYYASDDESEGGDGGEPTF